MTIVFIAEKKKAAKPSAVSDDYENEVEFLSKQLEDLSVYQSFEQRTSSMAQNENHFATGTISDISDDESLQDIDTILPSNSNGHSSHSLEKSSPHAKMDDVKMKFSAAALEALRSDDDDDVFSDDEEDGGIGDDSNDDDHNSDDIHWDLEPLQMEVLGYSLDHDEEPEINEKSQTLVPSSLKGVKVIPDLKHVFKCINTDDYYNYDSHDMKANGDKPIKWPLTSLERNVLEELKPIPCTGSQSIVKSRHNNKGHGKNPSCTQKQNEKPSKSKLSDADLIEIFGSSDEESEDNSIMVKQSTCSTKLKGGTKTCATRLGATISRDKLHGDVFDSSERVKSLHTPPQHAKMGFPCDADCTNVLTENGREVLTNSNGCLASILQDDLCAKSNVSSFTEDANLEKGAEGNKEEQPKAIRKVLEPANTILNNTFQPSMQGFDSHKKENSDSVDDICYHESSGKFQENDSLKENTASPFGDYMPAPLSKRLGKQFSAKQRLAILHSISSVTDDS